MKRGESVRNLFVMLLSAMLLTACQENQTPGEIKDTTQSNKKETLQVKEKQEATTHHKEIKDGITYIDGILIVNKDIGLPKTYHPDVSQVANQHLNELIAAGHEEGLNFVLRSAFRSYETQTSLYNQYVTRDGQKMADTYSARPGHSEHQTGLAFDLGNIEGNDDFMESFENTKEGEWLKSHAHEYGFIIRYPKGKTDITGYQYEPWHLRYLGKPTAEKVYESGLTLEEYLGLK